MLKAKCDFNPMLRALCDCSNVVFAFVCRCTIHKLFSFSKAAAVILNNNYAHIQSMR